MIISELIAELEKQKQDHGDLPVYISYSGGDWLDELNENNLDYHEPRWSGNYPARIEVAV